jgi:hypothetical protein
LKESSHSKFLLNGKESKGKIQAVSCTDANSQLSPQQDCNAKFHKGCRNPYPMGILYQGKVQFGTLLVSNVKATDLTEEEFYIIAQLLSVLYPIGLLVKLVQTDRPGAIAYTYFFA